MERHPKRSLQARGAARGNGHRRRGMVMLGRRTSKMGKRQFAEFIEFIQSVAADRGVNLEPEWE